MNEQPDNDKAKLSDHQMDELLSVFYTSEVPPELSQVPSTWPEIAEAQRKLDSEKEATLVRVSPPSSQPAASRGIAVAVATLAACVMVMVFSSSGTHTSDSVDAKPATSQDGGDTMNVSKGGDAGSGGGVIGDDQTTLNEIDDIQLAPETPADDDEPAKEQ